jgi:hypothetical protein
MRGVVVLKAETACPGRSRTSPDQITICMTAANVCSGQTRSFGDVGSMSDLPESGYG